MTDEEAEELFAWLHSVEELLDKVTVRPWVNVKVGEYL